MEARVCPPSHGRPRGIICWSSCRRRSAQQARVWTKFLLPASYLQTPADIWLGKDTGAEIAAALGVQLLWLVVLLIACQAMLSAATRKVVVQGG